MLLKFSVKNYRGFRDRIEWDLSTPNNYTFNTNVIKDGVVKNGIIYGPNGCGKTNFSMAIFDIVNHLSQKWKKADFYGNFIYAGLPDGLVDFEYTFRFDSQIVKYSYAKSKNGILINESLFVDDKDVFVRTGKNIDINQKLFPIDQTILSNLKESANGVSIANFLVSSFPLPEKHYLLNLMNFVNGMLWFRNLDIREFIGLETGVFVLDEYIIKKNLIQDFKDFLKDVSGQEFNFIIPEKDDKILRCNIGGKEIPFNNIASTGTQSLQLLYFWIQRMNKSSFVFIDEFDAFYHFELSFEVCKRLFNLNNQVFTSSHNTFLMTNDLLRPDCYFIINDGKIKPLCACTNKELRFGHNIEKLYRGGAFEIP